MPKTNRQNLSRSRLYPLLASTLAISCVFPAIARAEMSEAEYDRALSLAARKAARARSLNSQSAHALSSSLVRTLFGRAYREGDSWTVASWSQDDTTARMTADPAQLEARGGRGGIFRYEVVSVKRLPEPRVAIRVTQLEEFGLAKVDARVQELILTMNDSMHQSEKIYRITDRSGAVKAVKVSPDGIRSGITPWELFALDVPELSTAEGSQASRLPGLPPRLNEVARRAGYRPSAASSIWFEQDDFFGRPVQAMWQKGDPWPAFLKTPQGVSILIRKEAA